MIRRSLFGTARSGEFFRGVAVALCCLALVALGCGKLRRGAQSTYRIGLVYIAPHELINQVVRGFRDGLAAELPAGSYEIIERHASGDVVQLSPTIQAVIGRRLNLMVTITTPASQIALQSLPASVPLCFLAVTDPLGAGLVESLERPVRCTGVSDLAPFEKILEFIRDTLPRARRIGLPYNPEEQPAVFGRDRILELAPKYGFIVEARAVTSKDETVPVVRQLAQRNDLLLIGTDNAMFEAAPQIVKTAADYRKPVFAGDSTSVKAGAVGGVTVDYYTVGRIGARMAARILHGEKAGEIPVHTMREGFVELNLQSAAKLGISYKPEVIAQAKVVYR